MNWSSVRRSLQAKLLVAVVVCALVPLAAVGAWLSSSAVRSGELLLRTQLDSAVSRAAATVQRRWQVRKSDVLMLATSAPVRAALTNPTADTAPQYARRAFATMGGIASVALRDGGNRVRWKLDQGRTDSSPPTYSPNGARRATFAASQPTSSILRAPVTDDAERPRGEIEAEIRFDALLPTVATIEMAPSQFIAYRDRTTGAQVAPSGLPAVAFRDEHFTWNDHRWLAVRQRLADPPIDVVAAAQLDPFLSPFTRTARTGAAALALVAAIVVVLTIVVTNRLTRSLGELALAADQVSHGALGTRVHDTSQDEVGRVGRAFNTMLASIARMMRELSQREAVAAMGELAATMAHQVRSPATAMRIDVQRAHDKLPAQSTERALLARALGQLDRMERAVDASLKLARASRTEFAEVDVREALGRAATGVRREHTPRAVELDMSGVPNELPRARGDAASLEQLFANVLTNAAQASADGGQVALSAEANGGPLLTVTVRDHGTGMSAEVLARAGEPLFSTKPEGTGLGLAIARRIAAAHGGSLAIESTRGSGTTVTIQLPRA
jgi:signal transduction histidine kinase